MKQTWILSLTLTLVVTSVAGLSGSAGDAADSTKRRQLAVDPAAEPTPALRYLFVPDVFEQTPGNATIAYQQAIQLFRQNAQWTEHEQKVQSWLACPLAELPKEDAAQVLGQYRGALEELRRAGRFEQCDWQLPIRERGVATLLPHLGPIRQLSRLLAARIRLDVAHGRYEAAIGDLGVGFSLARHVGKGALLIEGLVGVAIASQMLDRVEELIQQPRSPNLYWALTDLPPGFLSAWQATRWEKSCIYANFPTLRRVGQHRLTGADLQALAREMDSLNEGLPGELSKPDFAMLAITAGGLGVYPRAKQYLAERGVASDELEAMPVAEVLIRFVRDSYEVQRDNLFKWFSLPYTQAHAGLARAESEMLEAVERDPIGNFLARLTLPALSRASLRFAELDRRFALLRSLEAVRMHATAERRLPESLADIVKVPVPNDPITARPFPYRLRGNVGLFELEPVPGGKPPAGTVYELELRQ